MSGSTPLRLVCDTHILLEWLVWQSPTWQFARIAQAQARIALFSSEDIALEWRQVLHYPKILQRQFLLSANDSAAPDSAHLAAQIEQLCQSFASQQCMLTSEQIQAYLAQCPALPLCKDPDDQKFLQCAVVARADLLLTRDKKLIKIGRHRYFRERGLRVGDQLNELLALSHTPSQLESQK